MIDRRPWTIAIGTFALWNGRGRRSCIKWRFLRVLTPLNSSISTRLAKFR